jgi:hypothetical protein
MTFLASLLFSISFSCLLIALSRTLTIPARATLASCIAAMLSTADPNALAKLPSVALRPFALKELFSFS